MNTEKIREDFPALNQKFGGKPVIYFDNACMTLRPKQVIEAMNEYYEKYPGCVGRSNHKFGKLATQKYHEAREVIAKFIGAKPKEVVFTRNTTEGINLVANALRLEKNDVVVSSDREHNSNLIPWQILAEKGIKHVIVKSNMDDTFSLDNFSDAMSRDVRLASVVHTSNLDGYTLPAKGIIKIAHDNNSLVLLDAAQSMPHKDVDVKKLDVDFLAFSGHKMLGPTGTGVLYAKYELLEELHTFMTGGETVEKTTYDTHTFLKPPEKFEAGLQNYAGAMGLAAATKYLDKVGRDNIEKHETEMNKIITEGMKNMPVKIVGVQNPELRGGVVPFIVKGVHYHDVALMLDNMANIMIRSGQHCAHSWFAARGIEGTARASLYLYNTKDECKIFLENMEKICKLVK
jgi:cysteine desulfurase/selenocysteine lyase